MYDFLFELTEHSENEGEQILVECEDLITAWAVLLDEHHFDHKELCFIERLSVEEGEMLGLDTY